MRKTGSKGQVTERALRKAGVRLIAKYGYESMNLRMLAQEVGIKVGSLYHHIASKQELLFTLLQSVVEDLISELDEAMIGIEDPVEQLKVFVSCHINSHTRRQEELFMGSMELRSLTPEHLAIIVRLRRDYEERVTHIIRRGKLMGRFQVPNERIATFGLIAMLNGICVWFNPNGAVPVEGLVDIYFSMALGALGASPQLGALGASPQLS